MLLKFPVAASSQRYRMSTFSITRAFTSQASRASAPALQTGWEARCGWIRRVLWRLPRFADYADHVFAPSLSPAHHALMFIGLHAPQRLDFDIQQFLDGAAVAAKRVLEDASDDDFLRLVITTQQSRIPSFVSSPVLRRMQSYCLPQCLDQLQVMVQRQSRQIKGTRTVSVEVESTHLTRVQYACLTENRYSDELHSKHRVFPADACDGEDHEPVVNERLQLQVEVRTLEQLQRTQSTERLRGSVTELRQRNVYVMRFKSLVTTPDLLDWRLASIALRTRGRIEGTSTSEAYKPAIE